MINPRGILVVAVFSLAMLAASMALAHEWFADHRYTSADGAHCCNGQDCKIYPAESVRVSPQGYVLHDGIVVPFKDAHVSQDKFFWRCDWGGRFRCLFVVAGGS